MAIRLAIQWGVFDALGDVGEAGKTSKQLADMAGADERLVGECISRDFLIRCESLATTSLGLHGHSMNETDWISSSFPPASRSERYDS
jgi:hypothetical protein